jgi:hypothetical protein
MKRMILTAGFALLLLSVTEARAQCDGPRRVAFQRGLTTAVLKGEIPTSKAICYQLRARAGQKMIVHLASPTRGVLFTVIPDGFDVEPIAQDVTNWEGVLESAGDYTVSVHAPRAGQTFALEISITSAAAVKPSSQSTVAPCGDFSGVYLTEYGPLRLTRTGNQVRGSYSRGQPNDSTVNGTVRGNVLTGTWREPDSKGPFTFTLDSSGRSFKGSFGVDGGDGGEWNGHCKEDGHR